MMASNLHSRACVVGFVVTDLIEWPLNSALILVASTNL